MSKGMWYFIVGVSVVIANVIVTMITLQIMGVLR